MNSSDVFNPSVYCVVENKNSPCCPSTLPDPFPLPFLLHQAPLYPKIFASPSLSHYILFILSQSEPSPTQPPTMNANTHPAQSTPQSVKVSPLDTADSALEMTPIRTEGPGVESSPDTLSLLMVGHPTQLLNFEDRLRVDLSLDNDKALFEAIEKHFSKAKGYHRFPGIKKIQSCHFSLVSPTSLICFHVQT